MQKTTSKASGHEVLFTIRERITHEGRWQPGERLPTRRELALELGATLVTVHRAIDRLQRDGFVVSRGKLGTFVADRPPHLANLALVFREQRRSLFQQAMHEVVSAGLGTGHSIRIYDDITSHADNEQYIQLVSDVRARRIGGLIFATSPHFLSMTPLMDEPNIPRVAVASAVQDELVPTVYPDRHDFLRKAITHLAQCGRKRPALVMAGTQPNSPFEKASERFIDLFIQLTREAGMTVEPWWVQGVGATGAGWAARLVHGMLHPQQSIRPDALVIADDNIVEYATAGLVSSGVNVPREVEVIAYTNFPVLPRIMTPVTRIGFDVKQIVLKCVSLLTDQRPPDRRSIPHTTLFPATVES